MFDNLKTNIKHSVLQSHKEFNSKICTILVEINHGTLTLKWKWRLKEDIFSNPLINLQIDC
jgi:hypothetical protein